MLHKRVLIAELTAHSGEYSLAGWVKEIKPHGFMLWDMTGEIMICCNSDQLQIRDVVSVEVILEKEAEETCSSLLATRLEVLNTSTPTVTADHIKREHTHLKFFNHKNIRLAQKINDMEQQIRQFLGDRYFIETRNPLLWTSVQEYGFNEFKVYNVLSRQFEHTLLQSPNILNLLNNIGGLERIFQFHPCFRLSEESTEVKTDALVEFTQLAINCDFCTNEEGKALIEEMLKQLCLNCFDIEIAIPFPVLDYKESIRLYGSDKPDFRYRKFLQPKYTEFGMDSSSTYKTLIIPYSLPETVLQFIAGRAEKLPVSGYSILRIAENRLSHRNGRALDLAQFKTFIEGIAPVDRGEILLIEGSEPLISAFFSSILRSLNRRQPTEKYSFCWIENYPFVEADTPGQEPLEGIGQNIFTKRLGQESKGIDLILNGVEIASGSEKEYKVKEFLQSLELLQISEEQYAYYLDALKSGSPPVFTIGIGWERLLWKLMDTQELQDVMIFPKDQNGQSYLFRNNGAVAYDETNA
ncbi:amino acid--tRNA ligase-related protein [Paenibacillus sp. FSL E2-0178]|uniref:amino acid--tRNA ligase-related protein n=1 Tax=Paenibacillus sp. FSL E2-0178 TaxID=2921361 RepID=UPI00315856BD